MGLLSRVIQTEDSISVPDKGEATLLKSRLKEELVDSFGLLNLARMVDEAPERAKEEIGIALEGVLWKPDFAQVTQAIKDQLVREILDEVVGFGPLQPLLDDQSVTEIMVNGLKSLYYEKAGELCIANRVFSSEEQIRVVLDRILAPIGRRVDEAHPVVNARLPTGDRLNAVIQPISLDGPVVTIRKFSNRMSSLGALVDKGALPNWFAQILSIAVQMRKDIAVVGGTGSGKTTLLNALSSEISHKERIITIEDSAELRFHEHPHVVRLETREQSIEGTGTVSIRDLVKNALRMRPDRIIVGEVRGEEAIDMLQAMNTGHDGSLTTLHAGDEQEAILRLVLMARFGMDIPTDVIEAQIATALDLIVMSKRLSDGSRYVTGASEVVLSKNNTAELRGFVVFDEQKRSWQLTRIPEYITQALSMGLITDKEVKIWQSYIP